MQHSSTTSFLGLYPDRVGGVGVQIIDGLLVEVICSLNEFLNFFAGDGNVQKRCKPSPM